MVSMADKERKLADMMERRKIDILCVQETKSKDSKARNVGGDFKIFHHGLNESRNKVDIILKEQLIKYVLEVQLVSNGMIRVKVEGEGERVNKISAYGSQVECNLEEKENFWSELDEVMQVSRFTII